ncbi:MAG: metal dependent phosphohydrolase [Clostridia bacterium]|jgi:hypothetical protein|nr:metal dependent phosphohydrolase [Clostridia bacterium]
MSFDLHEIQLAMIHYFKEDVRRINHALKVHSFAKLIADLETLSVEERLIIEISALLHDIGIKQAELKYHSTSGKYQELEGPPVAQELLHPFSLTEKSLSRILYLIGHHHSYSKIDGLDFQILVESDFIVNIFEDGMSKNNLLTIKEKYFKTETGTHLLTTMFL